MALAVLVASFCNEHLGLVMWPSSLPHRSAHQRPPCQQVMADDNELGIDWPEDVETLTFSYFANWLLPGRLLVGRYPYLNPVYCTSRAEADEQLASIISEAGATTYVCLQGELPPQDSQNDWPAKGIHVPGFPGQFFPYAARANKLAVPGRGKVTFVHEPIQDLGLPSTPQLERLLGHLVAAIASGVVVYLHCWGGRGRTGLVAACLLRRLFPERDARTCLDLVQAGYSSRRDRRDVGQLALSPQTEEQRDFVRMWYSRRSS